MENLLDLLALPLMFAKERLEAEGIHYTVDVTRPTRDFFPVDETHLYVIRQHINADGSCHLIVAAAMGKEVL